MKKEKKKQQKNKNQACNLEKTSDTPLHSRSGLWLNFSEAVLAHSLDAKHNKRAQWPYQLGEALSDIITRLLSVKLSALLQQPAAGLSYSCWLKSYFFFFNKRLKAENILWQTEHTPIPNKGNGDFNPFIN